MLIFLKLKINMLANMLKIINVYFDIVSIVFIVCLYVLLYNKLKSEVQEIQHGNHLHFETIINNEHIDPITVIEK